MRAVALALLVAACSSDSSSTSPTTTFEPCFGSFECATVAVPLDYAQPNGATIGIRILRAPAQDPSRRLGAVVVNPGGPGVPFVDRLPSQYPLLAASFSEATARFDVVTFDWRGVGQSTKIDCLDDGLLDRLRTTDLVLKNGEAEASALAKEIRDRCSNSTLAPLVHTSNAARDLEAIRVALGESKLNYIGFSYGSWLGATYASLYPDHVGAFVFDATVSLGNKLEDDLERHAKNFQAGLDRFFATCGATCDGFDAFMSRLPVPAGARSLSYTDAQLAVVDGLRTGDFAKLTKDLAAAEAGDASALLARADIVTGRDASGHYDSSVIGLLAISCLDQPLSKPIGAFASDLRARYPRAAPLALVPYALCEGWPFQTTRIPIDARRAPPMLLISGRNDAITSYDQGPELAALLGNGSSFLTYEGEGHVSTTKSGCVRNVVTAFLIDPTIKPTTTSCPAE